MSRASNGMSVCMGGGLSFWLGFQFVGLCFAELFQADVDEFCQYYSRRDGGLCFPDFQRVRRPDSNYLGDEKIEDINRFVIFTVGLFVSHTSNQHDSKPSITSDANAPTEPFKPITAHLHVTFKSNSLNK